MVAVLGAVGGFTLWLWGRAIRPAWRGHRLAALKEERRAAAIDELIAQFKPNGGSSFFDQMARLESKISAVAASVRQVRERFSVVVGFLPIAVFEADKDGSVTMVAPAFTRWTHRRGDEIVGDGWSCIIHPDDLERVSAKWQACVRKGAAFESTHRFVDADGVAFPVQVEAVPVRSDNGVIVGYEGRVIRLDQQISVQALREINAKLDHLPCRLDGERCDRE